MKYLNAFFYLQNSYKSEETQREDNKSVHLQMFLLIWLYLIHNSLALSLIYVKIIDCASHAFARKTC